MSRQSLIALVAQAKKARLMAFAPYSKLKVGAALLAGNGKIYTGCNVENTSFGLTLCAERSAVAAMVADGERAIEVLAVVAGLNSPISPCGACRQVISEFNPSAKIVMANLKGKVLVKNLSRLLPAQFLFKKGK